MEEIKAVEPVANNKQQYDEKAVDFGSSASSDVEKQDSFRAGTTVQLKRKLQSRHLQMIAIGMTDLD